MTKATAQMGGLTREEIEKFRHIAKKYLDEDVIQVNQVCDLALQALSPKEQPGEQNARRVKCPDCPDGQLWGKDGPTSDACFTCGGTAFIWITPPPPERP